MTERWLFPTELTDKKSWLVARNVSAHDLVEHIAEKEHLHGEGQRIYPSTNLIYSFDDLILKIFAPAVCGYQAVQDYNREIYALQQLQNTGLRVPRLISNGCIDDRYNFYYLILERLGIPPASYFIDTCTPHELSRFGREFFNSIIAFKEVSVNMDLAKTRASLSMMLPERLKQLSKYQPCFIHADLSGNNILYDGRHLAVIDFEDWTYGGHRLNTLLLFLNYYMENEHILKHSLPDRLPKPSSMKFLMDSYVIIIGNSLLKDTVREALGPQPL